MRLRNWKETVEPTIEETLADVHPRSLDESFHYYAPYGSKCWVKCEDHKWRRGTVISPSDLWRVLPDGTMDRCFDVLIDRIKKVDTFVPTDGVMKPDTPEVRELLRLAGYFLT